MPHLAFLCSCGRRLHWPRNAKLGAQLRCRTCGAWWTLAEEGKPGWIQSSLPYSVESNPDYVAARYGTDCWYVCVRGQQYGPIDTHTMFKWMEDNFLSDDAYIWQDGWANWEPAVKWRTELGYNKMSRRNRERKSPSRESDRQKSSKKTQATHQQRPGCLVSFLLLVALWHLIVLIGSAI